MSVLFASTMMFVVLETLGSAMSSSSYGGTFTQTFFPEPSIYLKAFIEEDKAPSAATQQAMLDLRKNTPLTALSYFLTQSDDFNHVSIFPTFMWVLGNHCFSDPLVKDFLEIAVTNDFLSKMCVGIQMFIDQKPSTKDGCAKILFGMGRLSHVKPVRDFFSTMQTPFASSLLRVITLPSSPHEGALAHIKASAFSGLGDLAIYNLLDIDWEGLEYLTLIDLPIFKKLDVDDWLASFFGMYNICQDVLGTQRCNSYGFYIKMHFAIIEPYINEMTITDLVTVFWILSKLDFFLNFSDKEEMRILRNIFMVLACKGKKISQKKYKKRAKEALKYFQLRLFS